MKFIKIAQYLVVIIPTMTITNLHTEYHDFSTIWPWDLVFWLGVAFVVCTSVGWGLLDAVRSNAKSKS